MHATDRACRPVRLGSGALKDRLASTRANPRPAPLKSCIVASDVSAPRYIAVSNRVENCFLTVVARDL